MVATDRRRLALVAALLFASGFCALVYQVAWLRALRLVFGASTASSAAVLAIFMAGLGLGSLRLGRRADRSPRPLALYGTLEVGIALLAGASPWLVELAEAAYVGLGGSSRLGLAGATALRIALSLAILGLPTFLMGGTLPAAVRAVTGEDDRARRALGSVYAVNTIGAVLGAALTTFVLLETLGLRGTVVAAAGLNLAVGLLARWIGRRAAWTIAPREGFAAEDVPVAGPEAAAPPDRRVAPFVLAAAGLVGFSFFLMELVWYRLLGPILGGSTYTFGIILAVALAGIGVGGLLYGAGSRERRPTLVGFAATCALEAVALAIPFALGWRVAFLALVVRQLQAEGFAALALGWTFVAALVILPAAIVAGYQFPLLVGVLGEGGARVGREVGQTYAWNTVGAIAGSLAGGFGLLPFLSAPGAWRLVVALLALLAVGALVAAGPDRRRAGALLPLALACLAALLMTARGPGAYWRHGGIGAGRAAEDLAGPNELRASRTLEERATVWETDGRESGVALQAANGYSFVVNGKTDGHARLDAPTQVMSALLGALLHPDPRTGLVIGLGTGSSAGWLAAVPSVERVEVVELEPAIVTVAEACAPVNLDVLASPKLDLVFGDGRELLLTTDRRYDLIFSEPSNPYRAGIASLFTRDFYEAVEERLAPGGLFIQWLQAYEVDASVVQSVYVTLSSVFPAVETWQVHHSDLMLVASREPIDHDLARVAARLRTEPYRSALQWAWGMEGPEGFYTGLVGGPELARRVAEGHGDRLNTDDHPVIEFGFARGMGRKGLFTVEELRAFAGRIPEGAPAGLDGARLEELREVRDLWFRRPPPESLGDDPRGKRREARALWAEGRLREAIAAWRSQPGEPIAALDLLLVAEGLADVGDPAAWALSEGLDGVMPVEAEAVRARLRYREGRPAEAAAYLARAFAGYRGNPWPYPDLMERALELAAQVGARDREAAALLFVALEPPFSVRMLDDARRFARVRLAEVGRLGPACAEAFAAFEPWPHWSEWFLARRADCYEETGSPLAADARADLVRFRGAAPARLTASAGATR